jgi:hypothetical protein
MIDQWVDFLGPTLSRVSSTDARVDELQSTRDALFDVVHHLPMDAAQWLSSSEADLRRFILASHDPAETAKAAARGQAGTVAFMHDEFKDPVGIWSALAERDPELVSEIDKISEDVIQGYFGHLPLFSLYARVNSRSVADWRIYLLAEEVHKFVNEAIEESGAKANAGSRVSEELRTFVNVYGGDSSAVTAWDAFARHSPRRLSPAAQRKMRSASRKTRIRIYPGILESADPAVAGIDLALTLPELLPEERRGLEDLRGCLVAAGNEFAACSNAWQHSGWRTRQLVEMSSEPLPIFGDAWSGENFGGQFDGDAAIAVAMAASNDGRGAPSKGLRSRAEAALCQDYLELTGKQRPDWSRATMQGPYIDFLKCVDVIYGGSLVAEMRRRRS